MSRSLNMTDQDALFKEFYGGGLSVLTNVKTPLLSILNKKKRTDFVGDTFVDHVRMDVATGLGYRATGQNLPTPGAAARQRVAFTAAKSYGVALYDREAILASRNDRGAFAKATVTEAESVVEGHGLHMLERVLFGDSTGKLGEISAAPAVSGAGTTASPWSFALTNTGTNAPKGKRNWFVQGAPIDLYTAAGVYQMTIVIVSATVSAGVVTITATTKATGSSVTPVALDIMYWEGNKDAEMVGLGAIAPTVAGTLYGVNQTTNPKFRGLLKSVSGALQYGDVGKGVDDLAEESIVPNLGVCSYAAFSYLKDLSEDQKRYNTAEAKSYDAKISFKGIEIMGAEGAIPLVPSQMCPSDEIFLMNTNHMSIQCREDFGWFDADGKGQILVPDQNKDQYFARYGGYSQLYCDRPNSVLKIYGFTL